MCTEDFARALKQHVYVCDHVRIMGQNGPSYTRGERGKTRTHTHRYGVFFAFFRVNFANVESIVFEYLRVRWRLSKPS